MVLVRYRSPILYLAFEVIYLHRSHCTFKQYYSTGVNGCLKHGGYGTFTFYGTYKNAFVILPISPSMSIDLYAPCTHMLIQGFTMFTRRYS